MLMDKTASSETDIKIRFNSLCYQFDKNQRYIPMTEESQSLSEKEDIGYEMSVHNKRYEAVYYQKTDSTIISEKLLAYLHTKYTNEQIRERIDAVKEDGTNFLMDLTSKKSVWFMIEEKYGEYRIAMYYDNEYNHSDGEDL